MKPTTRHERLARRRRLYTGGALLIVAPLAGAGCSNQPVIAIAPADKRDAGPVDATVIAPIRADVSYPVDGAMAIAPFNMDGAIAIAPMDLDAAIPADAGHPVLIAPHPTDASTPADVGAVAIAPVEVDGGTSADAGKAPPGGYGATCSADGDCLQEYSCQTPICIVACPSACVPLPCSPDCPTGFTCAEYGSAKTCVRDPGGTPGGYGATCVAHTDCLPQLFCQDTCPGMCIVPIMRCTPLDCSTAQCPTDVQATCEEVGITKVCVRK